MAKQVWDRWAILCEVKRRGSNLKEISLKAGLSFASCSASLVSPNFPTADKALSDFLGVPLQELWPDRYFKDGTRKPLSFRDYQLNRIKHKNKCENKEAV
jgi:Ner family transcriptional regulator